ncbi:UDP-N-acetylmuramoyl-L-alanyl-D-glutamate:meso-diaminopimelate ligase [Bacteroidales bacterium]|nr:UDP-N-acetylmuramoyl-L-alanyl-D-glutamate:meso-diaminopimelate ligase [Bacteroidales bacterium]
MMQLKKLVQDLQINMPRVEDIEINGIQADSRKIVSGFLFIAVRGSLSDGHQFIDMAIENGAIAIVCEILPENCLPQITYIQVKDSEHALGIIASSWNGNPSEKMQVIGITGTNGKTSIATLLYQTFTKLGHSTGLISTVCNYIKDKEIPATHTTPDPISLNDLLAQMLEQGCEYVFMEVSSHAIAQKRISGLHFRAGIFSNLTRDHLDYHLTFDAYRDAKKAFFDALPKSAFALVNTDDRNGSFMLQNTRASKHSYSLLNLADFKSKIVETHFDGTLMLINGREINTQFVGRFNAYNILAVYGTAVLLGANSEDVLLALSSLKSVAGRFQTFQSPHAYTAIVDYAHTPDALKNVLTAIHEVLEGNAKIITVLGCGGNRDRGKRPLMAQEACRLSDQIIITSDNPRFEEAQEIINDMMEGIGIADKKKTLSIIDRKEAIKTACLLANTGDVVLVAGKGHEDYQEIKGKKNHFSDKAVLLEIFQNLLL